MDPLTALGLASNVLSFVSFASSLIKGTLEINASASGCPIDVTRLDSACQRLQSLCDGLQSCVEYTIPQICVGNAISTTFAAVKDLCTSCKADADELLRITSTLRTKSGSRGTWDSFRIALKKAWTKSSIEELEARLSRTQGTMTLHICTLGQYCSSAQFEQLESLQQRSLFLHADQATAIERISEGIKDLQTKLRPALDAGNSWCPESLLTVGDVACLQEKLQSLSLSQRNVKKQQTIIESLTFESRHMRHRQIPTAHEETFHWALTADQTSTLGPRIGNWLRNGDGIFWVSGKPGSGKSTLMKHIGDSMIAARLVDEWARPCKVTIISHYFWIAGTYMQKSQKGLLQTLLHDIFRKRPDLIEHACEQRWRSTEPMDTWSTEELRKVLQTVLARDLAGLKFFFIIDGLDEYSGDHEDHTQLCRTLKALAASPNVKICVSSRPWNIFEEEFGLGYPKLYMQDLTRGDIEKYASHKLSEHTRWAAVSANHSQGQWLISEVVAKSSGVFLWVFLVVKLLREGLTNRDAFSDLRRRLESFPSELEPFFKSMLEAVEPFYHSHMSTALQIAKASTEDPLSFLHYNFHFQEYEDRDYAVNHQIRLMGETEIAEIRSNISWRLDSRTRGLLEINPVDGNVTFLHRTVRDFLNTREMHDFLAAKADSSLEFCPMLSVFKAHLAVIKHSPLPNQITRKGFGSFEPAKSELDPHRHFFLRLTEQAIRCASELESHNLGDVGHHALLDELDRTALLRLSGSTSENVCRLIPAYWSEMKQAFVREQIVRFKLFDYLHNKLAFQPSFLKDIGNLPVLQFISTGDHSTNNFQLRRGRGFDLLVFLLQNRGMDVNKQDRCTGVSPWDELIRQIIRYWYSQPQIARRVVSFLLEEGILALYLKAGADPSTQIIERSPVSDAYRCRAVATVYLEWSFDVLDQSPRIQGLYLELALELLRISSKEVRKDASDDFCATLLDMDKKDKEKLHDNLPLFAEVIKMLRMSLGALEPETIASLKTLDYTGSRIFPLSL